MGAIPSFKFGAPSSTAQPSAPSLSVTNPTPGSTPNTAAAPFSFGNSSTSAQPAAGTSASTGGLFGNAGQNQQPQAGGTGGSLFGSFGAKPATATPSTGGSLFGSQSQPQQNTGGGGLFGSTSAQPQQQQQSNTGGGLFGSTTQQPSTAGGGGLFGSTSTSTQQQPQGSSLFGSTTNQQTQQTGTGLFGSTNQQSQASGSGLLGSTNTANPQQQGTSSVFGQAGQPTSSSLFGQTAPTQQQQAALQTSANGQNSNGINKSTKFADLPENVQKHIEQMDTAIKTQKAQGSGMNIEGLGRAIWQTSLDVKAANEEYHAISHTLKSLSTSLSQLRDKMINEGRDVERVKEIWDVYRSAEGRMGQVRLGAYRDFPHEFFARIADQMEERVGRYKKTISQLNRAIVSLTSEAHKPSPQAIAQTIQNHQQAMLTLAAQLDGLQLRMNGLRSAFAEEWRERTGSVRDPFEIAREEKAVRA
uniref:Nucleoporin p58/p45 n=1 Tax=Kwoniella dejecticola CBS 10117 TaxID=1296121 RepID=A0A1A6AEA0_9TREE|nr:uncharacterized protein I303_00207 [Kwoniella dejecticola CBS 10117]OBR88390.1 hypothetical protein I303_00207 [Kwoniella dejecticola CBS 10117]